MRLVELAHWTIAGSAHCQLDDFGYWYEPEGHSEQQQLEFEQVEIKPQIFFEQLIKDFHGGESGRFGMVILPNV